MERLRPGLPKGGRTTGPVVPSGLRRQPVLARIEVDVRTRLNHGAVIREVTREERVAEEVPLPCLAVLGVDSAGVAAVELPHAFREPATRQLDDEVMVVPHQHPGERPPRELT